MLRYESGLRRVDESGETRRLRAHKRAVSKNHGRERVIQHDAKRHDLSEALQPRVRRRIGVAFPGLYYWRSGNRNHPVSEPEETVEVPQRDAQQPLRSVHRYHALVRNTSAIGAYRKRRCGFV